MQRPAQSWSSERVYFLSEDYFYSLIESISQAKKTVILEVYIFQEDVIGKRVMAALIAAAERGVVVRVMVDGVGSYFWINWLATGFSGKGPALKIYQPLGIWVPRWIKRRLHRKTCVVDGNTLFLGSFNISAEPCRDTAVRLTGAPVAQCVSAFYHAWGEQTDAQDTDSDTQSEAAIRIPATLLSRLFWNRELAARIRKSRYRVWITSAYFVPPLFLVSAILGAKLACAEVILLIPERSNFWIMQVLAETYYSRLLSAGVRIFEYQGRFLHTKSIVADDWALVGSSNFNHRSIFHDLEADAVLRNMATVSALRGAFLSDLEQSNELFLPEFEKRRFWGKIIGWIVRLFRSWL